MNKILFCLPTLYKASRKQLIHENIDRLIKQCKIGNIEFRIQLIINEQKASFENAEFNDKRVEKKVSDNQYHISRALNKCLIDLNEDEYFCFMQDDFTIFDDNWIKKCIGAYEDESLNAGVIGARKHSTGNKYCFYVGERSGVILEKVLWSDGIMFFSHKIYKEVGLFDETYRVDRESQDYCYSAMKKGYTNYCILNKPQLMWDQLSEAFTNKSEQGDIDHFMKLKDISERYFVSKWADWENQKIAE